jgi:hypothetical protein
LAEQLIAALSHAIGALGYGPSNYLPRENKMITRAKVVCFVAASGFAVLMAAMPAQALTMQECSAKYKAAQTAGTLNGQKWNDFRKAECGTDAAATPAAAPAAPKAAEAKPAAAPKPTAAAPVPAPATPVGNAVFPNAVDPKYASEKPGLAREHTCADQWKANKAANTTGGMKWNAKGGGYYSECNKKLKGSA